MIHPRQIKYVHKSSDHFSKIVLISKTWNQLKRPSTGKWINKLDRWYSHMMKQYSVTKRNKLLLSATRLDLKGTTLGEEKKYQSQKFAYDIIHIVFSK